MARAVIEYELMTDDGTAFATADDDYFYVNTDIVTGSDQDITGSLAQTVSRGARSVTLTKTDANSSVTAMKAWLTGYDATGAVVQETITFTAGTVTMTTVYAYKELTSVIYHADGTAAAGVDQLKIGFGTKLGLTRQIAAIADILRARVDSTKYLDPSSGAGTFSATYNTWDVLGGVVPDGARRYYITVVEEL